MDRRRFRPQADPLEGRQLLSTATGTLSATEAKAKTTTTSTTTTNTKDQTTTTTVVVTNNGVSTVTKTTTSTIVNDPDSVAKKERRVANLPYYLAQIQTGRYLPPELMTSLQQNLNGIIGKLKTPSADVINGFNARLRDLMKTQNLDANDAAAVNRNFGTVLQAAGATPEQTSALQQNMNDLAKVDANSKQPSILARNDYSTVIQTALAVGRAPVARTVVSTVVKPHPKGPVAT